MDRFSTRLAASVIDDRRREAAAARRFADARPTQNEQDPSADRTRRLVWPIRVRAGAR